MGKPVQRETRLAEDAPGVGRRSFLLRFSWAGLALYFSVFMAAVLSLVRPRVSNRPAQVFSLGYPGDYRLGQVAYHREPKVFVVRSEEGFSAISARCTHLGCTVVWNRDHRLFLCPCHGGKFDIDGRNVAGPPPRPLDVYALQLSVDGWLEVDKDMILTQSEKPPPRFRP